MKINLTRQTSFLWSLQIVTEQSNSNNPIVFSVAIDNKDIPNLQATLLDLIGTIKKDGH